jgi:hypothetical protein
MAEGEGCWWRASIAGGGYGVGDVGGGGDGGEVERHMRAVVVLGGRGIGTPIFV